MKRISFLLVATLLSSQPSIAQDRIQPGMISCSQATSGTTEEIKVSSLDVSVHMNSFTKLNGFSIPEGAISLVQGFSSFYSIIILDGSNNYLSIVSSEATTESGVIRLPNSSVTAWLKSNDKENAVTLEGLECSYQVN